MYAEQTMYTIRQAAARSGVSVPLLRAWERRYGIVEPARTASGYRLYDDAALDRLRTMRRLVSAGWTPSTAASAILAGDPATLPADDELPPAPDGASAGGAGAVTGPPDDDRLVEGFVDAAVALDAATLESLLDRMFAAGSFEAVAEDLLLPALTAVGDAWASGRLSVAGEHAASHAVLRRLAAAYQAAGRASERDGAILVGMPPGVRHELGALAFSTAARRAGLPVLYLGPDLPVADWVGAALRAGATAVVVGVVTDVDVRPAVDVAAALRLAAPELLVAFGGRAADQAATALGTASRRGADALVLPEPVSDAVRRLSESLEARSRTPDR